MATKKNFKRVATEFINLFFIGAKVVGYFLYWLLIFVVFYSWPAFIVWCLIAPKAAARMYYTEITIFDDILHKLNDWIINILPFYAKKHFMPKHGIGRFPASLQLKCYFCPSKRFNARTVDTVKAMSDEAYELLWSDGRLIDDDYDKLMARNNAQLVYFGLDDDIQVKAYNLLDHPAKLVEFMGDEAVRLLWFNSRDRSTDYANVVAAGKTLTDNMFRGLLERPDIARSYLQKQTPSESMMAQLISLDYTCDDIRVLALDTIRKYGLSPRLAEIIADGEHNSLFRSALKDYQQRIFFTRADENKKDEFVIFLRKHDIGVYAQMYMKPWQYKIYHEERRLLDDKAIKHYLRKGDLEMAKLIFAYEPAYGMHGQAIKNIVIANSELTDALNQAMLKAKDFLKDFVF